MAASEISEQTVQTSHPSGLDAARSSDQDKHRDGSLIDSKVGELLDVVDRMTEPDVKGEIFDDVHVQSMAQNSAAGAGDEEEDAAIAEYLQDLLRRVNGRTSTENSGKTAQAPTQMAVEVKPVSQQEEEKAEDAPVEQPEPSPPAEPPGEYLPSFRAPEKATQLREMRDLANSTARQAIAVSKTRTLRKLYAALALSVLCMAVAAGLLVFTPNAASNTYRSGVGVLCVAMTLSFWFFHLLRVHNSAETPRSRPPQSD